MEVQVGLKLLLEDHKVNWLRGGRGEGSVVCCRGAAVFGWVRWRDSPFWMVVGCQWLCVGYASAWEYRYDVLGGGGEEGVKGGMGSYRLLWLGR